MKVPASVLDIRVSIRNEELIINCVPHALTRQSPKLYAFDCGRLPIDVTAWLNLLEQKEKNNHWRAHPVQLGAVIFA